MLLVYLFYLKIKNPEYLKAFSEKIIRIFYPKLNKYILMIVPAFVGLVNLNKLNNEKKSSSDSRVLNKL